MKRNTIFTLMYIGVFLLVSVPLFLNIKINELSNSITDLNTEILILNREKAFLTINHSETFSISNIEELSKLNSYIRLNVSQKINELEVPYKFNEISTEKISILGFSK
ncbi:MAG: hypothetical protein CMD88_05840 [Gammaproteobacteria bacterium]|nr:hypothetical protein [Gammaproteobacteria bacterium]|tara:strand:+ start:881 stop:1204 length:324 start_codon:yes stop_codon:yes gene_type:complete